jgi:hypothetical protein
MTGWRWRWGGSPSRVENRKFVEVLEAMSKAIRSKIVDAFSIGTIVRVYRETLEDGWAHGYVEAVGKDFFALSLIDDGIRFDGYNCFRFKDITKCVAPDPHADFLVSALKLRHDKRPKFKALDVSSLSALVKSAAKRFPLLTLHLEKNEDQVCFIGRLLNVSDEEISILQVTPAGKWEAEPQCYDLATITRVDFGGAYQQALFLVAG